MNLTSSKNWNMVKLGDLASFSQGIQVPTEKQYLERSGDQVRFIRIVDFTKNSENEIRYIDFPGEKYLVKEDDLVMIRYGSQTAGRIARGFAGVLANNTFKVIPDENLLLKDYLYLFLSQNSVYQYFQTLQSSSTMPAITFGMIKSLEIPIPESLDEQREITMVLGIFDDKIELLRKENKTLENIAQTLFKEWFIDFNFPGSTGKMTDSELGEIPEGWRVGKLEEVGKIICGKTPSTTRLDYFNGDIPFVKIPDMHDKLFIVETESSLTKEGADSQLNKYIQPNSICVSCIATVGLVSITTKLSQTNQQINSVIPKSETLLEYLYFAMKLKSTDLQMIGGGGSATLNVNTGVFSKLEILLPREGVLGLFHETITPAFQKIKTNSNEIQTLSKLRDELLNKIFSV